MYDGHFRLLVNCVIFVDEHVGISSHLRCGNLSAKVSVILLIRRCMMQVGDFEGILPDPW